MMRLRVTRLTSRISAPASEAWWSTFETSATSNDPSANGMERPSKRTIRAPLRVAARTATSMPTTAVSGRKVWKRRPSEPSPAPTSRMAERPSGRRRPMYSVSFSR